MTGHSIPDKSGQFIGQFDVRVDAETVRQFDNAISLNHSEPDNSTPAVALTYPACWLGLPEIKQAVLATLGEKVTIESHTLVHLEQSFQILAGLEIGARYKLDVQLQGPEPDGRCRVIANVKDIQNVDVLNMSGVFILVNLQDVLS
ncbi:MAG: hypothetical protein K8F25_15545 [Fimbriimonadaceae bacterium]|nr:hypothetical protein [Alphaproteobacteria bacterium]